MVHECSSGLLCTLVATLLSGKPSCGYAALVGNLGRFCEVSHIERVTHLISSYLLLPLTLFMEFLHIFPPTPRPHMKLWQFGNGQS